MRNSENRSISMPVEAWNLADTLCADQKTDRSKLMFRALLLEAHKSKNKAAADILKSIQRKNLLAAR